MTHRIGKVVDEFFVNQDKFHSALMRMEAVIKKIQARMQAGKKKVS